MTLTIDLPPEVENRLEEEAGKQGMSVSDYACHLIEQHLLPAETRKRSLWETLTPEEWKREFHAWLDSHDPNAPALPPEAFERASFYGDRG